jgi:hypothetical protein
LIKVRNRSSLLQRLGSRILLLQVTKAVLKVRLGRLIIQRRIKEQSRKHCTNKRL